MLRRRWLMVVLLVMGLVGAVPVQAAGAPWTVWLYENQIGRMTQVDDTGTVLSQFQLPAEVGSTFSREVAISANGLLLAYTATSSSATLVNVYDLTTFATVYSMALPPTVTTSLEFGASSTNFNAENTTFAFGYVDQGSGAGWKIIIIDLVTFSTFGLNEESPVPGRISSPAFGFMLPVVMRNRDLAITFMMIPLGTDGAPSYDAYTWNIASNSISPNAAYITPDAETFERTGEVVSTLSDVRFPESADPISGYSSSNTLQVFDPVTNERFIVTSIPRIYGARFIQGGERVALVQYANLPDGSFTQSLQVLDRNGAVSGSVAGTPVDNLTTMAGTLNGLLFTASSGSDSGGTTLYYVETRLASGGYTAVSVWNSSLGAYAWLAWTSDTAPLTVGPFTAWGRLEPAASAAPTTPPIAPPASSVLSVGGQATVQTTDGDVLNLRSGPARTFDRLGTVSNGTIVLLLEGPTTSGDGLFWWRVRLPTGVEGWVVESADGVQTLIPR